jgi:4-amino-4-deoxy-L-arabinose transferase-like glycosyltransferase
MSKRWLGLIFLGVILAVGVVLRIQNLATLHPFDNDERAWLLLGRSLLNTGTPASWTIYWDVYPELATTRYGGLEHVVARPYLDHPPLFGLAIGAWAKLTGNGGAETLNWAKLRFPMVLLAYGTLALIGLFVNYLLGKDYAVLTTVAMVFFPAHALASRFIAAENAIAFLLMLGLCGLIVWDTKKNLSKKTRYALIGGLAVISGAAIWVKLSGVVVPATLGLVALLRKRPRIFMVIAAAATGAIGMLMVYGAWYDWEVFWKILSGHTTRPQSFWSFWTIVTQMDLGYLPLKDPSWIVGFVGIFLLMANSKIAWSKRLYIFAAMFNFSLLFLFVAPVEAYGWYKYALLPLLGIGLGYVLTELMKGRVIYYVLLLPFGAMLLEQSELGLSHDQQRIIVLLLYGWIAGLIILREYASSLTRRLLLTTFGVVMIGFFWLEMIWINHLIP